MLLGCGVGSSWGDAKGFAGLSVVGIKASFRRDLHCPKITVHGGPRRALQRLVSFESGGHISFHVC